MSRTVGLFEKIAARPMEAIEALVAGVLFLSGLWLCSPLYEPEVSTGHQVTGSVYIPIVLGAIQVIIGGILFYGLWKVDWPLRIAVRSTVTYIVFLLLSFYAISGILIYKWHRLSWISSLSLALIAGVCHLALKVNGDGRR